MFSRCKSGPWGRRSVSKSGHCHPILFSSSVKIPIGPGLACKCLGRFLSVHDFFNMGSDSGYLARVLLKSEIALTGMAKSGSMRGPGPSRAIMIFGDLSLLFLPQQPVVAAALCVFLAVLDILVTSHAYRFLLPDLDATILDLVVKLVGKLAHFLASIKAALRLFPTHPRLFCELVLSCAPRSLKWFE